MILFSWQYAFLLLAAGILLRSWWPALPWLFIAVVAGAALLIGWRINRLYHSLFITGFIILGLLLSQRILPLPPTLEPQTATLTGVVQQIPTREADYQQTILKCANRGYYQQVVLYLPFDAIVKDGDTIRVAGKLSTLQGVRNPGDPNRRLIKGYQHLYYQFKTADQAVEMIKPAAYSWRQKWHDRFVLQANRWMKPSSASILTSVIWGDAAALNDDDYRLFQEIGLLHIFAASGMNVGCLMLAAALLMGLFTRRRGLPLAVGLAITVIYAALIGWPVSILRAVLMALFASLAYLGGRKLQLKESLFLAATLLLIIDPGWLFSPGFQLTIIATWGLMVLYPALASWWFPQGQSWWQRLLLPILAAELAVWPLTVYYFNLVAPVSLLANLVLAPLISLLVILGTLALFSGQLSFLAALFFLPSRYLLELIMTATSLLHTAPGGYWWVKSPPLGVIIVCFILLWLITQVHDYPRYRQLASGFLLIFIIGFSWPRIPSGQLVVTFLDVGQGDSIHISTREGRQILIDGGGSARYPVGRLVVVPYLHRQGINRLDLAIATHPHDDHMLGLLEVLPTTPCPQLALPRALAHHPLSQRASLLAETSTVFLESGTELKLDKYTTLRVLSPEPEESSDVNNSSLVLLLQYGELKVLLMGDAEAPVARALLDTGIGTSQVIKIGHHGSVRSRAPDFYERLESKLAVISVGRNNGFGHPSPGLLNDLEEARIKVLRTDQVGAIRLVNQKGKLAVFTYAHP